MAQAEPQVDARFTQRSRAHWQTPTHLRTSHTLALVSPLQTVPRSPQPLSPTRSPSSSVLIQSCVHSCSRRAPLVQCSFLAFFSVSLSLFLSLCLSTSAYALRFPSSLRPFFSFNFPARSPFSTTDDNVTSRSFEWSVGVEILRATRRRVARERIVPDWIWSNCVRDDS